MSDPLEDLLDRSAPALADRGPSRDTALQQMVRDARDTARPAKRPRRRVTVLSALAALLLVGSAGVVTANSDWLWSPGLENPDRSYAYTAPTWGQCEIRVSGYEMHDPFIQADVNRIIDEWFAATDVEAAAAPYVAKYLAQIEADRANDPEDVGADPRLPDLNAWFAHEQALSEALHNELTAHGYDSENGLAGSEGHSQLHCEYEDWGGTEGAK